MILEEGWVVVITGILATAFQDVIALFRSLLTRLVSYVVEINRCETDLGWVVMTHLEKSMKRPELGVRLYDSMYLFVRPLDRIRRVVFHLYGRNDQVYWKGWRPMWITGRGPGGDSNEDADFPVTFTFIRGTFNWEEILKDALSTEEETKAERQQALKQQGEKLAEEANRWSKTYDIQRENLELNKQKAKDQSETGAWKDVGPGPNGKGVTIMDSKTGKTKVDPSRSYIPTGRNASGLSYINENNTGLTGKDFNETLPVGVGRNVHGLANYDIDPKTIPAYGGQRAAMMEAAQAENPDYKPAEFQFRQGSKLAYMPGKPLGIVDRANPVTVSR